MCFFFFCASFIVGEWRDNAVECVPSLSLCVCVFVCVVCCTSDWCCSLEECVFAVLRELQSRSLFICVQSGATALNQLHPLRPTLGHCVFRHRPDMIEAIKSMIWTHMKNSFTWRKMLLLFFSSGNLRDFLVTFHWRINFVLDVSPKIPEET